MRDLIYFVAGGDPKYVDVLDACITSIRHYPENDRYDILVMCDRSYAPLVAAMKHLVYIYITPDNATKIDASMRKTEIFSVSILYQYNRVLYLDADMLVYGPLDPIFSLADSEEKLCVVPERGAPHTHPFCSMADYPYDEGTLLRLQEADMHPFNAGQFVFQASDAMRTHFETVTRWKQKYDPDIHFYEQSFMNAYFNRIEHVVSYALEPYVTLFASRKQTRTLLNHYCDINMPIEEKLHNMREDWRAWTHARQ